MPPFQYCAELCELYLAGKYRQALVICEQLLQDARARADEADLLQHLEELADLNVEIGQFEPALRAREEMLEIHTRQTGNIPTAQRAADLARIGYYQQRAERFDLAEEFLRQTLAMIAELPPDEKYEAVPSLVNLAQLIERRGEYDKAMELVQEAWRVYCRRRAWSSREEIMLLGQLAHVYQRIGKKTQARKIVGIICKAFDIDDLPWRFHPTLAYWLRVRARHQVEDHQSELAIASLQRALALLHKFGPPQEPRWVSLAETCERDLAKLLCNSHSFAR